LKVFSHDPPFCPRSSPPPGRADELLFFFFNPPSSPLFLVSFSCLPSFLSVQTPPPPPRGPDGPNYRPHPSRRVLQNIFPHPIRCFRCQSGKGRPPEAAREDLLSYSFLLYGPAISVFPDCVIIKGVTSGGLVSI